MTYDVRGCSIFSFSSTEPKAHWWAYRIGRLPSSVCLSSTLFKHILPSETTGPIEAKFHMASPWDGGTKICSNGPGHMTKMAVMPIYGENLKKSSSLEPKGRWPWNLVCSIGCSSTTKFVQVITLGWPWPILQQGQIWSLVLLYGKKVKQWIFQKLATDHRSDKKFLLTSKLCSLGNVCPLPRGYIHVLNHEKIA